MKNNRLGIASAAIAAFLYIVHLCHLCLLIIYLVAWFFLFTLPIAYFVGGLGSLSLSIGARFRNEPDLYYAKLGPFLLLTIPVSFVVMAFFEIGLKVNGMKDLGPVVFGSNDHDPDHGRLVDDSVFPALISESDEGQYHQGRAISGRAGHVIVEMLKQFNLLAAVSVAYTGGEAT